MRSRLFIVLGLIVILVISAGLIGCAKVQDETMSTIPTKPETCYEDEQVFLDGNVVVVLFYHCAWSTEDGIVHHYFVINFLFREEGKYEFQMSTPDGTVIKQSEVDVSEQQITPKSSYGSWYGVMWDFVYTTSSSQFVISIQRGDLVESHTFSEGEWVE